MPGGSRAPVFRDRYEERAALDLLVGEVRAGQSRSLVLRGEAGVGKTALIDDLVGRTSDCRVVRASGAESEMELAFAGLHQLCAPMLDRLDRLPGPQRDALATAFGLSAGAPPDRFMVGLAVLSLLSDVSVEDPLLCIVDDAQWMDRVSKQTLAFVARRLLAERVAILFTVRDSTDDVELAGLPELQLAGLRQSDARALLESAVGGRLDERVRDRIVAETRGNPLALLELPRGFTTAHLAGGFALPGRQPLASRIEASFTQRIEALPADTRELLLAAAAEPTGDVPLLLRAAGHLGIGTNAAAPAEAVGLFELGARATFRHPLVRSAVYRAAPAQARQRAHRALAEATDPEADPDRRAWHNAHAADGLDEVVAAELEHSADRAQRRGGVVAAAAFLRRAAALTPDPARRAGRALAAAAAELGAGSRAAAEELLASAELAPMDEAQRAEVQRLRAQIAFVFDRGSDGPQLLIAAARRLGPIDPAMARQSYLEALGAAMYSGRLDADSGVLEVARAARAAPPMPQPPRPVDLILDGMSLRCTEGPGVGVPALKLALRAVRSEALDNYAEIMPWLMLSPIVQSMTVFELWDDEGFHAIADRAVQLARDAGALALLSIALVYRSGVHVFAGELAAAETAIQESDAIAEATNNPAYLYAWLLVKAWRGVEAGATEYINAGLGEETERPEGRVVALAGYAAAVLNNGLARYEAAMAAARRASDDGDFGYSGAVLPELVEAAARAGSPEVATTALRRLEEHAVAAGTDWALGVLARSRALMSEGDDANVLYLEAIERLGRTRIRVELARAHLVYGEWLRREGHRTDARHHLRTAHEMFGSFRAEAFAERARRELQATGETVRKRTLEKRFELTAQEKQIAVLASGGLTNPEIGARLFLSPHTVEWHLRKVFAKLDITSRRQLPAKLPT